jgi:hypothetical protein
MGSKKALLMGFSARSTYIPRSVNANFHCVSDFGTTIKDQWLIYSFRSTGLRPALEPGFFDLSLELAVVFDAPLTLLGQFFAESFGASKPGRRPAIRSGVPLVLWAMMPWDGLWTGSSKPIAPAC